MKNCLTVAGSDCSGGAGVQADIKTFSALGRYAMSVVTAVVAENTRRVLSVYPLPPRQTALQMQAVFEDIRVDAVKIGMLPDRESAQAVSQMLEKYQPPVVVCDPVLASTSGSSLSGSDAVQYLSEYIFPHCTLITPNIPETQILTSMTADNEENIAQAAQKLLSTGAKGVLIKGGHLDGGICTDRLFLPDGSVSEFSSERINTKNTHGTGCTLSSAITAFAADGCPIQTAVAKAKEFVGQAIEKAFDVGGGHGPVNHFYEYYGMKGIE